jgi:transposase
MIKIGKRHSKQAKFEAVLALLQGNQTVSELCTKYSVHQSALFRWKREFLEAGPDIFDKNKKQSTEGVKVAVLQRKIGELTMDIDFLKEALGH